MVGDVIWRELNLRGSRGAEEGWGGGGGQEVCLRATGGAQRQAEEGDGWGSEVARSLMDSVTEIVLESILRGARRGSERPESCSSEGVLPPPLLSLTSGGVKLDFHQRGGQGRGKSGGSQR